MRRRLTKVSVAVIIGALALTIPSIGYAQQALFKVSGEGAIGEDSILVGKEFSLDLYLSNVSMQAGFTLGFILSAKKGLKGVQHIQPDSVTTAGMNVVGHNGFDDKSVWDLTGLKAPVYSWDGKLPDSILIGGIALNAGWDKTDLKRYVSIALKASSAGQLCVDSAFIPPGGSWMYADQTEPVWEGPYCFAAVKKAPKKKKAAKAKKD
ncbi:MAG: hypothetical protein ACE5GA_00785 [Candidatus Zixiibacteriota bacterium]